MSFRKRLLIILLLALVVGGLDALLAPFVVEHGIRWWLSWAARRHGLSVEIEQISAPFLQPVTIHNLSVLGHEPGSEVTFRAGTVVVDLNLAGWLFQDHAVRLRSLQVEHLTGRVQITEKPSTARTLDWREWSRLLPEKFQLTDLNLDLTTPTASFGLHHVLLTASTIESGRFFAREIFIRSPLLRRDFANLRGATSWEGNRLTIAGIPLAQGLDLEALKIDLSRLVKRRLGIDLQLDTYGGTLRASFLARAAEKFSIDLAGSAANLSLAQISSAMGFVEPITGAVRASKFTFRGNPGKFLDATASLWLEATDFAWRSRQADSVMLGATYYDRHLEVDQLYVRQRENELTVNGELLWPKKLRSWSQLPFRGQVNASIPDLNRFAQLFGARTDDFSGAVRAAGEVDLVNPEASGRLTWHGEGVTFRGVALESLGASLRLQGGEATLENLEARHANDFLRAEGTFELTRGHRFSGRLTGAIDDLGVYAPLLPEEWRSGKIGGGATFDWQGDGTLSAHSGTVQLYAHGLQLPVAPLRLPLDLTLEGSYSPRDVFFRTFRLASDRFSLGGFLMIGNNFVELQALDLTLDGAQRASGTLFLPFSVVRWRSAHSLLTALDEEQKFDVDLSVRQLDLAQLGSALGEPSLGSGILEGKLAAFGPLGVLQATTDWRLENFKTPSPSNRLDLHGRLEGGHLALETNAQFGVSNPVTARAWLTVRQQKKAIAEGQVFDPDQPFSASIEFPALFLDTLPNEWRAANQRGLLTGNIAWKGKLAGPAISGAAQLFGVSFRLRTPGPEVTELNAQVEFHSNGAVLDPIHGQVDSTPVDLRGRLWAGPNRFALSLLPPERALEVLSAPLEGVGLETVRIVGTGGGGGGEGPHLEELLLRGTVWPTSLSLTMTLDEHSSASQRTFFLPSESNETSPLLLKIIPPTHQPGVKLGADDAARLDRLSPNHSGSADLR